MKVLQKSRNRMLSGVLGGIAEYFNVDPTLIRLIFVVVALLSYGFPLLIAYIVAAFIMPEPY